MKHITHGLVSIVGAGPGDPELMTLKAARLLAEADVVVYDRLIPDAVLKMIPAGVSRIFAGKSCKQHYMTQQEINELLAELSRSGRRVVRLKGGDPFIFGRGGEEAEFLAHAGLPFEIVPGITSASGGSSYAGIPLTHRGLATSVRFLTGHMQEDDALALNWQSLADEHTTLVVYMGLARLALISDKLIQNGLCSNTPAAAIEQATTGNQRRVITTLACLHEHVTRAALASPTLVIIGKVVALAGTLDWFHPEQEMPSLPVTLKHA